MPELQGEGMEEALEGRLSDKGKTAEDGRSRTQRRITDLFPGLGRIREAAGRERQTRLSSLMHHLSVKLLEASYRKLNPKASPGIDGETWESYGKGLEERLRGLHERLHAGCYRAKPARRSYIPKGNGESRPLGIASLEDKIVQQAVVWILEQIYEPEFRGFSYGFRPGRSPHGALDALYVAIKVKKVNWILDADVRKFFDSVRHEWMLKFLEHRIADQRILRLVKKWLKAGVSEEGEWSQTRIGTPQGAVVSPILANIYLHYVLDLWIQHWRKKEARGEVIIVRYADDFVMGFQYESDARKLMALMGGRLQQFGLELHATKTRLIEFGWFAEERRAKRGEGKPETFEFLGFTHICGRSRRNGRVLLQRRTSAKRLRAKIKEIRQQLLWHRHKPILEQARWLRQVTQGYYRYHAIPGNLMMLRSLRREVGRAWMHALRRRGQKAGRVNWAWLKQLMHDWIPYATVMHPYPDQRLHVAT